ncbi:hypothetical protein LTR66_014925 [Elasticomyces elasticus]|nr:hypothetical protein LTR66_014925 [Elasticomyces elasticus]KAK4957858.1 hypothetical protein LTR28_005552 [Elasticomyces elasticus]
MALRRVNRNDSVFKVVFDVDDKNFAKLSDDKENNLEPHGCDTLPEEHERLYDTGIHFVPHERTDSGMGFNTTVHEPIENSVADSDQGSNLPSQQEVIDTYLRDMRAHHDRVKYGVLPEGYEPGLLDQETLYPKLSPDELAVLRYDEINELCPLFCEDESDQNDKNRIPALVYLLSSPHDADRAYQHAKTAVKGLEQSQTSAAFNQAVLRLCGHEVHTNKTHGIDLSGDEDSAVNETHRLLTLYGTYDLAELESIVEDRGAERKIKADGSRDSGKRARSAEFPVRMVRPKTKATVENQLEAGF